MGPSGLVAQRWATDIFAEPGHDFGQECICKGQPVAAEARRRAQQSLLDAGEGRRCNIVAVLPQHRQPKPQSSQVAGTACTAVT
jgi:hypothetical protein